MRVRFRGTRGSLPVPGPETLKYGGNTSCIEVRADGGGLLVLDAGTGIRELGGELAAEGPVSCDIFITHVHWDHISGLPFFMPLFTPGSRVTVHGPGDPLNMTGIEAALSRQMEYPFFPVRTAELAADIRYRTLAEGETVDLGFARVTPLLMNHPAPNFGYLVRCDGRSLFFTGDHEPFSNIYSPGDEDFNVYEALVAERRRAVLDLLRGVDLLIVDGQYTPEEYRLKKGWGHGSMQSALELARAAGVGMAVLTHHDVNRTDEDLDGLDAWLRARWKDRGVRFELAREGMELEP
ncbi:Ribonuclease BN [Pseudodesulfovibrio hydrargyri]|uniref:Ribonuclease BN n=1 Tax=Pseudodesulfovibrio hydrargyri TaxID=2125990 RepID=A0A1J5MZM1_9BACT|nr:MBL fold metallo-hydrolase [Pseudodesulfovibrio hydrargyri]OIQ52005.1 Ribonuclease BN [Pseudodesulfovibrio hydrargyri]